jgi:hypothetical protein
MEDTEAEVPEFATLLSLLWLGNFSVNSLTISRELRLLPSPPEPIVEKIREYWEVLALWLPGVCDACSLWSLQRTEVPYGAHAHLCPFCTNEAIDLFERKGWPEPIWHRGEDNLDEA